VSEQATITEVPITSFLDDHDKAQAVVDAIGFGRVASSVVGTGPAGPRRYSYTVWVDAERAKGVYTPSWSQIDIPEGFVLMPRHLVEVGDEVISSHYGRRTVTEVIGATDKPGHHMELRFEEPVPGRILNERSEGTGLIPVKAHGQPTREQRALAALDTVEHLAALAHGALHPSHLDLTLARALLVEITARTASTYASLVKDLGESDRITRLSRKDTFRAVGAANEAREAFITFDEAR
jgi:hypothetical protein